MWTGVTATLSGALHAAEREVLIQSDPAASCTAGTGLVIVPDTVEVSSNRETFIR